MRKFGPANKSGVYGALTVERTDSELRSIYVNGNLTFHNDALPILKKGTTHREISPAKLELAKVKRLYVEAALDLPATGKTLDMAIDRIWQKLGCPEKRPTWRSVLNWRKRYIAAGRDIYALRGP